MFVIQKLQSILEISLDISLWSYLPSLGGHLPLM